MYSEKPDVDTTTTTFLASYNLIFDDLDRLKDDLSGDPSSLQTIGRLEREIKGFQFLFGLNIMRCADCGDWVKRDLAKNQYCQECSPLRDTLWNLHLSNPVVNPPPELGKYYQFNQSPAQPKGEGEDGWISNE